MPCTRMKYPADDPFVAADLSQRLISVAVCIRTEMGYRLVRHDPIYKGTAYLIPAMVRFRAPMELYVSLRRIRMRFWSQK